LLNFCWISHGRLFYAIDANKDGHISKSEWRAFIFGIEFEEIDLDKEDAVDKLMKYFNTSHNDEIDKGEFVKGIKRWLRKSKRRRPAVSNPGPDTLNLVNDFYQVS
jgi:Ca2+-binding EF-hand superfamily protein